MFVVAIFVFVVIIVIAVSNAKKTTNLKSTPISEAQKTLLNHHVVFYKQLDPANKLKFEERVQQFLSRVRITGVKTNVEDLDRLLIASGAIIPIFGFEGWEYTNLNEVLLYPESFNSQDFNNENRNTLGVVGTGAYQNIMILSKDGLREGFTKQGAGNVAIHEFVHLIDKTDGAVDGIPEVMMDKQYILPWLELMHREIQNIKSNQSDIDAYGITNQAEFLAVVAEYFFSRPAELESKHPELYKLLVTVFRQPQAPQQ